MNARKAKTGFHIQRISDAVLYTKYGYTGQGRDEDRVLPAGISHL